MVVQDDVFNRSRITTVIVCALTSNLQRSTEPGNLDDACANKVCPASQQDTIDSGKTMATVSTVGFVVGAVGLGLGSVLLLTSPSASPTAKRRVEPQIGLGSIGLRGAF